MSVHELHQQVMMLMCTHIHPLFSRVISGSKPRGSETLQTQRLPVQDGVIILLGCYWERMRDGVKERKKQREEKRYRRERERGGSAGRVKQVKIWFSLSALLMQRKD